MWQYMLYPTMPLVDNLIEIQKQLNQFGELGWELVTVIPTDVPTHCCFIFKQPTA